MLNFVQQHQLDDFYYIGLEKFLELVATVCAMKPADFGLGPDEERGMPGEKHYMESGWSRKMLGRYFAAGFCAKMPKCWIYAPDLDGEHTFCRILLTRYPAWS